MTSKTALFVISFLALASNCTGQDLTKEIAECAAVKNSIERLAAYDSLASRIGVSGPAVDIKNTAGKWTLRTETSPFDDKIGFYLSLVSEQPVKVGYKSGQPTMFIVFKEGNFALYINYGFFLGSRPTSVTTRLDKNDPKTYDWEISTDHKAIFYQIGSRMFVDNMMRSDSLVVRLTPYGESPVTTSFNLVGLTEAIKPILKAMGEQ
jgi:type VI secretion system protein VasI